MPSREKMVVFSRDRVLNKDRTLENGAVKIGAGPAGGFEIHHRKQSEEMTDKQRIPTLCNIEENLPVCARPSMALKYFKSAWPLG